MAQAQAGVFAVQGTQVTTSHNVRLELQVRDKCLEFKGDASGAFTMGASPLRHARLRSSDWEALKERGTLFAFDVGPKQLSVRFYDPADQATPLGELRADPVPLAGNATFGSGTWTEDF